MKMKINIKVLSKIRSKIRELSVVDITNAIFKGGIYLLAFLIPLFFLPFTTNVLDFNKQFLLVIVGVVIFFAWMINSLVLAKIKLNISILHIPIFALFVAYFLSAIFSLWSYGSFWGWPLVVSESVLTLFFLIFIYFLISNTFEKKEILYILVLLLLSGLLASVYGLFQIFGKFIFPWDFARNVSFNTIGTINSLGIFSAILLPLNIIMIIFSRKKIRILSIFSFITMGILLAIINFNIAWWVVIAGTFLIILLGIQRKDFFDGRWLILPMFFLVLGILFLFVNFKFPGIPERPIEVYLTQETSANIALKSIEENPILGSGPGTFIYSFLKNKDIRFNEGIFWNFKFDRASSKVLTVASGTGILGAVSFVFILVIFLFYGIKNIFFKNSLFEKKGEWLVAGAIFTGFFAISVSFLVHSSNLVIDFLFFVLAGTMAGFMASAKKEIILKPSSLLTLAVTFVFVVISIFGIGITIIAGQRYFAEANYAKGIEHLRKGNIEDTINKIEKAVRINPNSDLYWRELSQVYLQKVNFKIESRTMSGNKETIEKEIGEIHSLIRDAMNTAKIASDINPKNVANWAVRGFVYQNFIGTIEDSKEWSVKAYEEALKLEPTNPYFPTQAGISNLKEYSFVTENREAFLRDAELNFQEAQKLKPDYAPARFQMAIVYILSNKTKEAIEELEKTKEISPYDVGLLFQLGIIYYNNGDYNKAKLEFERAVLIEPKYANALYFLGLSYDKLNEKERAINIFEKVRELNPNNQEVKNILNNLKEGKDALSGIEEDDEIISSLPIEEEDLLEIVEE